MTQSPTPTKQDSITQLGRIASRLHPIAVTKLVELASIIEGSRFNLAILAALIKIAEVIEASPINAKSLQEIIDFSKLAVKRQEEKSKKRSRTLSSRKPEIKSWQIGE